MEVTRPRGAPVEVAPRPRRFEILSTLGEGGMGVVYKARDTRDDRIVALKKLRPGADARAVQRFRAEAAALASLMHPANVRAIAHGDDDEGTPFIAMELVPGESLASVIAAGKLDELRALRVMIDVLAALEEAHAAGIIHRDIKPANILMRRGFTEGRGVGERPVVCDYGIAKHGVEDLPASPGVVEDKVTRFTRTAGLLGTPAYMSPEQALGEPLDARTDVYSAGVVFYEMLAGRVPFKDDSLSALLMKILDDVPPALPGAIDPEIVLIVQEAMTKDRERRTASAAVMRDHLERAERRIARQGQLLAKPTLEQRLTRPVASPAVVKGVFMTLFTIAALVRGGVWLSRSFGSSDAASRSNAAQVERRQRPVERVKPRGPRPPAQPSPTRPYSR